MNKHNFLKNYNNLYYRLTYAGGLSSSVKFQLIRFRFPFNLNFLLWKTWIKIPLFISLKKQLWVATTLPIIPSFCGLLSTLTLGDTPN